MKNLLNIGKIGLVILFSAFIVIEIYVLANISDADEIAADAPKEPETAETVETAETLDASDLEVVVPHGNLELTDAAETEAPDETEPEIETEPEPEPETETETPVEEVSASEENEGPVELIPKNMPVLMYHTSSEANPGGLAELYVKPSEFEKQLQYLSENGYTFCTFDDYRKLNDIDKPVFITFDDGYRENYSEIFPLIKKYGAKITVFLLVNNIEAEKFTLEMIREMSDSGLVKFESHTLSHADLSTISSNDAWLTRELGDSKTKIEEITGKPVLALAYPAGKFNNAVIAKVKEYYSFGVRADLGMHKTDYDPFEIRRIRVNRSTSLENFINSVK